MGSDRERKEPSGCCDCCWAPGEGEGEGEGKGEREGKGEGEGVRVIGCLIITHRSSII